MSLFLTFGPKSQTSGAGPQAAHRGTPALNVTANTFLIKCERQKSDTLLNRGRASCL